MSQHQSSSQVARLRHRRIELQRRYERALERVALFPNPINERQVADLAGQIAQVDLELVALGVVA